MNEMWSPAHWPEGREHIQRAQSRHKPPTTEPHSRSNNRQDHISPGKPLAGHCYWVIEYARGSVPPGVHSGDWPGSVAAALSSDGTRLPGW